MKPRVYDLDMARRGILRHAREIGYRHVRNDLYTASLSLPARDEDNALLENVNWIVDIFDGERSAGKYRVSQDPESEMTGEGALLRYRLEHVIAFLFDDPIDGYLEIGGAGVDTEAVIRHLLSLQTVKRWQLGRCDFHYQFQYGWENEDILPALFSIPKCFADDYRWTYDTDAYPWTLNLVRPDAAAGAELRYRRNLTSVTRSCDRTQLCTRLICLGSGEGVNQTNIASVNPTGKRYLESANVSRYGVITKKLIDKSISDPETLLAKGRATLRQIETPVYVYAAGAVDLSPATGEESDYPDEGKIVRVVDEELNLRFEKPVVAFEKMDVEGDPLAATVEIASQTKDVSSAIESMAARSAITAQYAQGATNLFPLQVMDNADEQHPCRLRFFVPQTCVHINQALLSWRLSSFRAYETGAAAGGRTSRTSSEGGASRQTSSEGGASEQTSSAGGSSTQTSSEGGGSERTSGAGGGTTVTSETKLISSDASQISLRVLTPVGVGGGAMTETGTGGPTRTDSGGGGDTGEAGKHYHMINGHTHTVSDGESRTGSTSLMTADAGAHSHSTSSHTHGLEQHAHGMSHTHTLNGTITVPGVSIAIPSHSHSVSIPDHAHTVDIPDHTHSVRIPNHTHSVTIPSHTHEVEIPDHTHGIVYGIYEGGRASSVAVTVDGNEVPAAAVSGREIDVIPYIDKDADGRITRGTWHEITLTPDKLTRIEANLFVQSFVRSYAGGEY